jgi:hypothetical protein
MIMSISENNKELKSDKQNAYKGGVCPIDQNNQEDQKKNHNTFFNGSPFEAGEDSFHRVTKLIKM